MAIRGIDRDLLGALTDSGRFVLGYERIPKVKRLRGNRAFSM